MRIDDKIFAFQKRNNKFTTFNSHQYRKKNIKEKKLNFSECFSPFFGSQNNFQKSQLHP